MSGDKQFVAGEQEKKKFRDDIYFIDRILCKTTLETYSFKSVAAKLQHLKPAKHHCGTAISFTSRNLHLAKVVRVCRCMENIP